MDYEKEFPLRLSMLREKKDISARNLSLEMGQNPGYINSIERGKAYPTMTNFFMICQFLDVSTMEFFCYEDKRPVEMRNLIRHLGHLNDRQFSEVAGIVNDLAMLNRCRSEKK